jgi:butyryl-CoA dehydrogenase
LARTDATEGASGFSTLIVEKDTPGFSFGTREDKFGLRGAPTGELVFDDCRIPKENLLGQAGNGLKIISALGAMDCISQAAVCVGIAQAALDASVKYAKERLVVESRTLAHFENAQCDIADMSVAVEAMRLLTYRAALSKEKPDPLIFLAAMFGNEMAMEITDKAVALHGGYGCTKDFSVGRYFRDAKTLSLQKTPEHVKAATGKMLLGISGPSPEAKGSAR